MTDDALLVVVFVGGATYIATPLLYSLYHFTSDLILCSGFSVGVAKTHNFADELLDTETTTSR